MTTLQALKILKTEFEDLNIPQKDGSFKSLMCLEDVLIEIVKKMKPEVRRFVNAQKRKKIITVENLYRENLIKEKRKNRSCAKNRQLVAVDKTSRFFKLNKFFIMKN